MKREIHGRILELSIGDITLQQVDAIVNAANSGLVGGGGVDGAIHRRGGPAIMADTERRYPEGCPTGSAVISVAGDLPARHVIHAVGPRLEWRSLVAKQNCSRGAYRTSLELASRHACRSVALPAISCGIYGYPVDLASRIALATTKVFLEQDPTVELVRFVLFGEGIFGAFSARSKNWLFEPQRITVRGAAESGPASHRSGPGRSADKERRKHGRRGSLFCGRLRSQKRACEEHHSDQHHEHASGPQ